MCPHNVLIFPGEAENAFELYRSLRYAPRFTVFGASSCSGHGNFVFERYRDDLPAISAPNFIIEFNRFIEANTIRLVFPTHDSVALFLREREKELKAAIVTSGLHTVRLCRDKEMLYRELADEAFCPALYASPEDAPRFPVYIKPAQGQGGQGCLIAETPEEARRALSEAPESLICEYLPGREYTVDCFSNRHGALLFAGPRSRDVVKMGIAFQSSSLPLSAAMSGIAERLQHRLRPRGLWFFQLKEDSEGALKLLEVSSRMPNGMGLYRQLGVNFAQLAAYDALDMDVTVLYNEASITQSRSLDSRYRVSLGYDTAYFDLDDTLVAHGKVCAPALLFLYQCAANGKRVILLTRHDGDVRAYLELHAIHTALFAEIIHVVPGERKSDHIRPDKAILIDNLFKEREEAHRRLGIPVFDVDAIEGLLAL